MLARKRLHVAVHPLVDLQQRLAVERLLAVSALVSLRTRDLLGMTANMLVQVIFTGVGFSWVK